MNIHQILGLRQRHRQTAAELDAAFERMQAAGQGMWQISVCSLNRLAAEANAWADGKELADDVLLRIKVLVALLDAIREAPADEQRCCISCETVFAPDGDMPGAFGMAKASGSETGDIVALAICEACSVGGQDVVMTRVTDALGRWSGHKLRYFGAMHVAGHA